MVQGIGDKSNSLDYGEVGGSGNQRQSKKNSSNPKETKTKCEHVF